MNDRPLVAILMGSKNDRSIMEKAADLLREMGVAFEMKISSAHRSPEMTIDYARNARERGIEVIIAGAGMAAHLAGVVASYTTLPVIGVPLKSGELNGMDALYSTVQMPTGVPVATVAINGSTNAALLASEILSIKYPEVEKKIDAYRRRVKESLLKKSKRFIQNS